MDGSRFANPCRGGAGARGCTRGSRRAPLGFTIVDILTSIAVVAVLVSLLLPALAAVREATRRVVCASNERQMGLGIAMYAGDYRGYIPRTMFATAPGGPTALPQEMMALRPEVQPGTWDGLGLLYSMEFTPAAGIFYCPSHRGDHPFERYANGWMADSGVILCNYQYRGAGPQGITHLDSMPSRTALVTDGLRTILDFNHVDGANVLRADMTVSYFHDRSGQFLADLPTGVADTAASQKVATAWNRLDGTEPIPGDPGPGEGNH